MTASVSLRIRLGSVWVRTICRPFSSQISRTCWAGMGPMAEICTVFVAHLGHLAHGIGEILGGLGVITQCKELGAQLHHSTYLPVKPQGGKFDTPFSIAFFPENSRGDICFFGVFHAQKNPPRAGAHRGKRSRGVQSPLAADLVEHHRGGAGHIEGGGVRSVSAMGMVTSLSQPSLKA